jgi:hypothetical protein
MAPETEADVAASEPIPPPWPLPRFRALSRKQSIVAWLVGAFVGIALGAIAVLLLAPTHVL